MISSTYIKKFMGINIFSISSIGMHSYFTMMGLNNPVSLMWLLFLVEKKPFNKFQSWEFADCWYYAEGIQFCISFYKLYCCISDKITWPKIQCGSRKNQIEKCM